MERLIESGSSEETFLLGKQLGQSIREGTVICLYGDLGSGKTVLAKGLGEGLGVTDTMTSPTFTLIQEYSTKIDGLKLIHMDLYRLRYPEEAEIIGVADYFRDDCVCLLEWPEIIVDLLPEDRLEIRIQGSGDQTRLIMLNF
ncbi:MULTISPECIES: tRNA (adenosine(37)-N6)-threonylcarbamoyltransferase complex ATPase subunit type 1 TsaE [Dehalobacter]|jgi:tRNA threonylcarbamoyladenosine biosynthesis protein TsaE|uniref:tRNA threonylcarbamoyladenosine biosynthesis protein TsaE n=1 Tax=Dehalobacter restrictus TaxID=55583 RepID=A0A857DLI3_9FIRM|nr:MULTISPECIES: tRNA (adenosine(37)-N6)-threonylcarbamoyltransferase complex ATPase subunit type 1 TsaE [Dehalobacter]MDJ0305535.1 tRNA (adenosine(37)-N6)-threonylcarbamoyltransferase complex ATPase subunit type 1 TsaE [Dehalobacter sp.]OCZ54670.1 tRNA (N6-adenosine(37)-N6)-threonylcarbamoyltransferase complex ATPase TsaE [Dehalobacter sp. TeCB1]QHA01312.1 tRNA (adenosine(37)-N6)-threonylcarbamoyltransferase complex ATPase subunit type 1 TsaE [Dehalobacter restrictus]